MAVPLIPVVMIGARIVARFAASNAGRQAAKKFAKEFGGRVVNKGKNLKSVQKAPTGSQATRQMTSKLKKDGIKPTQKDRLGPASSPKKAPKRDARGDKVQKGIAVVKKMDFRDFKTVAAAQKAGSDFFQGRDGKKKIAVTKEQLEKYKSKNKIKTNAEALRSYANMLRKK